MKKNDIVINDIMTIVNNIDFEVLYEIISPIIFMYIGSKMGQTFNLVYDNKPKNIKKINLPPELKRDVNDMDFNNILKKKFGGYIEEFSKLIIERFPEENLVNFYNNINNLKTRKKHKNIIPFINDNAIGNYSSKKNMIRIRNKDDRSTVFHELFHMSSSVCKNGVTYCGFSQYSLKPYLNVGNGLNEGYTELLVDRITGHCNPKSSGYSYETLIVSKISQIIGHEKMDSLYFNADLLGLINELKKYSTEDEIMHFIASSDFIVSRLSKKRFLINEKKLLQEKVSHINKFLINIFSKYIKESLDNNKISYDSAVNRMIFFTATLPQNVEIKNRNVEVLSEDDIDDIVSEVFGNTDVLFNPEMEYCKKRKKAA